MRHPGSAVKSQAMRKPDWLKTKLPKGDTFFAVKKELRSKQLFTVCEEAKCPNIAECWSTKTATFMAMGDTCTRACRFCHVKTGNPNGWLDHEEPQKISQSCSIMDLAYAVITMVDRDDLDDGGASHIARIVKQCKEDRPKMKIELLTGDFRNQDEAIQGIVQAEQPPDVFAHNLETIERLTPRVRDARASYRQSLEVLKKSKQFAPQVLTKSAIMLGLGEEEGEIEQTLHDLKEHGVDLITIGQYMRPTPKHLSIKRFAPPEEFQKWHEKSLSIGFKGAFSGPLIRSSYKANELFDSLR